MNYLQIILIVAVFCLIYIMIPKVNKNNKTSENYRDSTKNIIISSLYDYYPYFNFYYGNYPYISRYNSYNNYPYVSKYNSNYPYISKYNNSNQNSNRNYKNYNLYNDGHKYNRKNSNKYGHRHGPK